MTGVAAAKLKESTIKVIPRNLDLRIKGLDVVQFIHFIASTL